MLVNKKMVQGKDLAKPPMLMEAFMMGNGQTIRNTETVNIST